MADKRKKCTKCKRKKPLSAFSRISPKSKQQSRDGYRYYCRQCDQVNVRTWQERNREKVREINRQWHAANRDRINRRKRAAAYGMTEAELDALLAAAGGSCMICGEPATRTLKLRVDHCHTSSAVRGLLCHGCNVGLGFFRNNPTLLRNAIAYLSRKPFPATAG